MSIGIHVIGPGYGETIILELPDGSAGVIDAYRPAKTRFPAVDFLRSRLGSPPLSFLAVTHPHSDHCCGLSQIGDAFLPKEWWAFDAITDQPLHDYFKELRRLGGKDEVDAALNLPGGTIALEILRIHERVAQHRATSPSIRARLLRAPKVLHLCNGEVEAAVLTPGDGSKIRYSEHIANAMKTLTDDGVKILPEWHGGSFRPNLISASILLKYGRTKLLFTGDAESPLWEEWEEERKSESTLGVDDIHFLKIGHHGSSTAYSGPLYSAACTTATVAVLTPFSRCESPLPSAEGIRQIANHVSEVYSTNRFVSATPSGYDWHADSTAAVPVRWIHDVVTDSPLAGFLASSKKPAPPTPLPGSWKSDCHSQPELVRLLNPDLPQVKKLISDLPIEDSFRFSVYFDEHGREIESRRFCGIGVGRLAN